MICPQTVDTGLARLDRVPTDTVRFDNDSTALQVAESLCTYLDEAELWWSAG